MKNKLETLFLSTIMFCMNASLLIAVVMGYRGIFTVSALFIDVLVFGCVVKGLLEASGDKDD